MLYHFIAFSTAVATGAADADCVGYFYKINGECVGVQQFANAEGCGLADGGKDSHPVAVDRQFCEEFGTARDPADQQVGGVSWGNLGKPGAASFSGEVNDPTLPYGCLAHSNQNIYQWNTAMGGTFNKWWRVVCMTTELPSAPPPSSTPAVMRKCKEVVPDASMSMPGADPEVIQLCKVINGNVMSPMWGNGKDSDCGTDAGLIAASTNSVDDCRAMCDNHALCQGWSFWDQNRLAAPFTKDDQGCYLYGSGTKDQIVPANIGHVELVASGTCFPEFHKCTEVVPDASISMPGADPEVIQLCKVINGNVMSPMWGNGKDSDCGTDAGLIAASTNSVDDCRAMCESHTLCLGWSHWDQNRLPAPFTKDDKGCYLYGSGTEDQIVPVDLNRVEQVASGTCFPVSVTPAPTCDCRLTDLTHAEGARCMGPAMESIGYRQTANWCCSDYGCSKGYTWVDPASDKCLDDTFVGTCMFTFIENGGCNVDASNEDTIMAAVDPECFTCDHIGNLVDDECMATSGNPIHILNDMIDDARRLANSPLPAGDNKLQKMNRKISKIRSLLKERKDAARDALNCTGPGC